jgi:hypothetical protein
MLAPKLLSLSHFRFFLFRFLLFIFLPAFVTFTQVIIVPPICNIASIL